MKLMRKRTIFEWSEECDKALEDLKEALRKEPVLKFPEFNKEFIIVTDAPYSGLGVVLLQEDDNGQEKPVAFASRTLKKTELNYLPTELESLGIVFALTKFKNLIYEYKIRVHTNHSAAVHIFSKTDYPCKRLARWAITVNDFHSKFEYIKGKKNVVVDYLSRYIRNNDVEDNDEVKVEKKKNVRMHIQHKNRKIGK